MTEVVGGLSIRELSESGSVIFETKPTLPTASKFTGKEKAEYYEELENHSIFDLLSLDEEDRPEIGEELFENVAKNMLNILPSGKIKKQIIRNGYGAKPHTLSTVKIQYNAYVEFTPEPFDSTYARKKPFLFTLGEGQCIEGLEIAVETMQVNEKSLFLVDSELAYKDSGLSRIPPNSTILFDIELIDITENSPENAKNEKHRDFDQVYNQCLAFCHNGKEKFKFKDYSGATNDYETAIKSLENVILDNYEQQLKADELLCRLYTNCLICFCQLEKPKKGCFYANSIYQMAKNKTVEVSPKVYFSNAKCLKMLGDFKLARKRLLIAKRMAPNVPEIDIELEALKKTEESYKKQQRAFASKMFN